MIQNIDQYESQIRKYAEETGVSASIHPKDFIFQFLITNPVFKSKENAVRYYFHDGMNSAMQLASLMKDVGADPNDGASLFEFASGYGCVSRHLMNHLPGAKTVSCDIHGQAVDFLKNEIDVSGVMSNSTPEFLEVHERFDVVFALSFFSHMPRSTWLRWLIPLYSRVKEGGVIAFTTQGLKTAHDYMGNPKIPEDGFWFSAQSEQKDLDTAEYGQTVVTKGFVEEQVKYLPGAELIDYREAYWWTHQDLFVVRKTKA